jgi:predicted transposase YbfD/YdcC
MTVSSGKSLIEHLKQVPEPRVKRTRRHELMDILVIALCAVLGGADDWVEIVLFAKAKKQWFEKFLKLPNGIPSHDTFGRVFRILDSEVLEQVCIAWLQSIAGQVQGVVAIDGKSLCGSRDGKKSPLHIVSAWACQNSMLLGQVQTDKKSNEITAIPELLKLLSIKGCIVTIDAMGCQKAITKAIVDSEADYVLNLKSNHRHLHLQVASWFEKSHETGFEEQAHSHYVQSLDTKKHARIESRQHWLIEVPEHLKRATKSWTKLQTIAMVRRTRQVGEKTSEETHYYISSLPLSAGAQSVAKAIRSHWAVENELHWSLDVSFREDACRVRKDEGPANLACLRRVALTQLKRETSLKVGIKNKRSRAGWDQAYMEQVLEINMLSI